MEDISWFIGGGEPGAAEYGAERGVDSRVGAVKVAAGEGAACDTITILDDTYVTSMSSDIVGRVHERPYCRIRMPMWLWRTSKKTLSERKPA